MKDYSLAAKIPSQRDSPGPHTREWGCAACVGAAIVELASGRVIKADELRDIIIEGTQAYLPQPTKNGPTIILDNKVPAEPGLDWWRVFVNDWCAWMEFVGDKIDFPCEVTPLQWVTPEGLKKSSFPVEECFAVIENRTEYVSEGKLVRGQHFSLGVLDPSTRRVVEIYNPWSTLNTKGIASYRLYAIRRKA